MKKLIKITSILAIIVTLALIICNLIVSKNQTEYISLNDKADTAKAYTASDELRYHNNTTNITEYAGADTIYANVRTLALKYSYCTAHHVDWFTNYDVEFTKTARIEVNTTNGISVKENGVEVTDVNAKRRMLMVAYILADAGEDGKFSKDNPKEYSKILPYTSFNGTEYQINENDTFYSPAGISRYQQAIWKVYQEYDNGNYNFTDFGYADDPGFSRGLNFEVIADGARDVYQRAYDFATQAIENNVVTCELQAEYYTFLSDPDDAKQNFMLGKGKKFEEAKVSFNIIKKDDANTKYLPGAVFTITFENVKSVNGVSADENNKVTLTDLTSNANGTIAITEITRVKGAEQVIVRIVETEAPAGYIKDETEKVMIIYYDANGFTSVGTGLTIQNMAVTSFDAIIPNEEEKPIEIEIIKRNYAGKTQKLPGAEFTLKFENVKYVGVVEADASNTVTLTGQTTNDDGKIDIEKIMRADKTKPVTVTVTETKAPAGYSLDPEPKTITVNFDQNKDVDTVTFENDYLIDENKITAYIDDMPKLTLDLLKTNSVDSTIKIAGAKFKITLTNVKSIKNASTTEGETTIITIDTTSTNGEIKLEEIELIDGATSMGVTIEETEAPKGYKLLQEAISFTVNINNDAGITVTDKKGPSEFTSATITGTTINVGIKNIPIMALGGRVWEEVKVDDGKTATTLDGIFTEKDIPAEGVQVYLWKQEGDKATLVEKDAYGNTFDVKTDRNGQYEFLNLPVLADGNYYYVEFLYDGINYKSFYGEEDGFNANKGHASEEEFKNVTGKNEDFIERKEFNERFKEIMPGGTSTGIELTYVSENGTSTLITKDENGVKKEFRMFAYSDSCSYKENYQQENWKDTWYTWDATKGTGTLNKAENIKTSHINLSLEKRIFDLELGMDVVNAVVSINGVETKYNYNKLDNGTLTFDFGNKDNPEIAYNLALYNSDYNFRIEDYKTTMNNNEDSDFIKLKDEAKELDVKVRYKVAVRNDSLEVGKPTEITYEYDEKYTFLKSEEIIAIFYDSNGESKTVEDFKVEPIEGTRKLKITLTQPELLESDDEISMYLWFGINKDANGNVMTGDFQNSAEITRYTTVNGLVDCDSQPGNMEAQHEDDDDTAPGLNVYVKTDDLRTITGTVWEDTKTSNTSIGNAKKDENENVINDVTVQLVELVEKDGKTYEYIWQEAKTGSEQVKAIAYNGNAISTYKAEVNSGEYKFTNFIPGTYIIRFIYGDGTSEDIIKYNGQDYKSTINKEYMTEWYNNTEYTGESIAVDNEARRLEVMSYSTEIDNKIGTALENGEANANTWMCAETAKIRVLVDTETQKEIETANEVKASNLADVKYEMKNMNFGLIERPITKLVIEKHITALKVKPNGNGVSEIVNATAKIEEILNGEDKITLYDNADNLTAFKATRESRNYWQIQTDITELAQGADLEARYTYAVINKGETDYLSETLTTAYETKTAEEYKNLLKSASKLVKEGKAEKGQYLGTFYYNGEVGNDQVVKSKVEEIQEGINNELTFVPGEDFEVAATAVKGKVFGENGAEEKVINTVIKSTSPTSILTPDTDGKYTEEDTDYSKEATVINKISSGVNGITIESYIAEISKYSNAAGRRDMDTIPGNLEYANDYELKEDDEFWAETISITPPYGADGQQWIKILSITVGAIALFGLGIIFAKEYDIIKNKLY